MSVMSDSRTTFSPSSDPRLRKACDRCHAQKLGCQRSPGARKCVRCAKANKPCTWSISLRNRRNSTRLENSNNQANLLEQHHGQNANKPEDEQDVVTTVTPSGPWTSPRGPWNQDEISSSPMLMDILANADSLYPYTHTPTNGAINHNPGELERAFHALSDPDSHYNLYSSAANPSGLITPIFTNHSTWLAAQDEIPTGAATPTALDLADLVQSSQGEFEPPTTTLEAQSKPEPPLAGASDPHRRWLLKIIDINVQLFNHLHPSTGSSGPLRNQDHPGDRSDPKGSSGGTLDDSIGLSMRLFKLLQELSDSCGEERDGQTTPYDEGKARGGREGGGPTRPLDLGSVLLGYAKTRRVTQPPMMLLPMPCH